MDFREHVALAPYTTFEIGGPARWFVEATSEDEVLHAAQFARERDLPLLVLGGGSNLLISDHGFPGLVLHMASSGIQEKAAEPGGRLFSVAAGENWDAFVSFAVGQGCGGVECLAGIPGTVGGTPIQNVGAYGQEVSSTITRVRALDLSRTAFVDLLNADCGFCYRSSVFNAQERGRYLVTVVDFELPTQAKSPLGYKDLVSYFKGESEPPSPTQVATAVREIRHGKGMLLVPGEADCRSAGSFFKNPQLPQSSLPTLAQALGIPEEEVPRFPAAGELVKVPAAWLLEKAGFHKGYRLGRAGISSRHTLAVINTGGASADEVLALRDRIIERVRTQFGITLETEPVIIG